MKIYVEDEWTNYGNAEDGVITCPDCRRFLAAGGVPVPFRCGPPDPKEGHAPRQEVR